MKELFLIGFFNPKKKGTRHIFHKTLAAPPTQQQSGDHRIGN